MNEAYTQLARKSVLLIYIKSFDTILSLLVLICIQRYLGFEALGLLAFSMAFIGMFSIFSDMGLAVAHTKRINEDLDYSKCNGTLFTLKMFLNVFVILLILLGIYVIESYGELPNNSKSLIYILSINLFFFNTRQIYNNICMSRTEVGKTTIPNVSSRLLSSLSKVFVVLSGFGIVYVATADILGTVFGLLLSIYLIRFPISLPDWNYVKLFLSFSLPVVFLGLVSTYAKYTDKLMIQLFLDSTSVGIYTLPERMTKLIFSVSVTVSGLLFVAYSNLYPQKRFSRIKELSHKAVKIISLVITPVILFLLIFTEKFLVLFFGNDAILSTDSMRILLIACYIASIRMPYASQIVSTGHLKLGLLLNLQILFFNIALNLVFIPDNLRGYKMLGLGVEGAAFTYLLSILINLLLIIFLVKRITKTSFYQGLWKHLFSALIIFFSFSSLNNYMEGYIFMFASSLFIPISYVLLLGVLKEIERSDIDYLIRNFSPSRMHRYVKNELSHK